MFAPDMNASVESIIGRLKEYPDTPLTTSEREVLNLYYVAGTRALVRLINATYFEGI